MTSFKEVIDHIVDLLKTDSVLEAYCRSSWGKSITVRKVLKKRTEISLKGMPLIQVIRPRIDSVQENNVAYEREHTVSLYCLFHEDDVEKAFDQLIEFEEAIDHALLQGDRTFGELIDHIDPGPSANDEGRFHPVYCIVKDYRIKREEIY